MPGRGMAENLARSPRSRWSSSRERQWRYSVAIDVLGGVLEQAVGAEPAGNRRRHESPARSASPIRPFGVVDINRLATPMPTARRARCGWRPHKVARPRTATSVSRRRGSSIRPPSPRAAPAWPERQPISWPSSRRSAKAARRSCRHRQRRAALRTMRSAIVRYRRRRPSASPSAGRSCSIRPRPSRPVSAGTWQLGRRLRPFLVRRSGEAALTVVSFSNTAVDGVIGAYPGAIRDAVYG